MGSLRGIFDGVERLPYVLFCLALGCFWCWNWVVFQSAVDISFDLGGTSVPCRAVSLVCFSATSAVYYGIRRGAVRLPEPAHVWVRLAVVVASMAALLACDAVDGTLDGSASGLVPALVSGVATGVAGAVLYMLWGGAVVRLGFARFRLMVAACAVSGLVASLLAVGTFYAGSLVRQVGVLLFLLLSPLLGAWFHRHPSCEVPAMPAPTASAISVPGKFLATLAMLGLALGLMQSIFSKLNDVEVLNPLASAGFVAASVLLVVAIFALGFDFSRLLYQVGFPLVAAGFLWTSLSGSGFAGYFLCVAGYRFCEVVVWVLCVYLMERVKDQGSYLLPLLGCVLCLGQAASIMAYELWLQPVIAQTLQVAVAALLLGAIYLVATRPGAAGWGLVAPGVETAGQASDGLHEALADMATDAQFTQREAQIFALLAQGKNKTAISRAFTLSENTVKTHIARIYRKLGVHSQQDLIGLVDEHARGLNKSSLPQLLNNR